MAGSLGGGQLVYGSVNDQATGVILEEDYLSGRYKERW